MARPKKYNLDYFPLDVNFFDDDKVILIEEDFGIKGGYVAIRLMAMVYEQGYYMEWKPTSQFTVAKRVGKGITGALVMDILRSCLRHGLFNEKLFDGHAVLSSKGIQERWLLVMQQLRRKIDVSSTFWLVNAPDALVSSEETYLPTTLSTQRKVKEIKLKEIKEELLPDAPAPLKKVSTKKNEEPPEPHWEVLVKTWFDFGIEKFQVKPSFDGQDPKIFKRIVQRLKKRAAAKKVEWTQETGPARLRIFLEMAFSDKWISQNFLLSNLERQFDKVIQNQAGKKATQAVTDLQYLFERFCEGDLDPKIISAKNFIELKEKGLATIDESIIAHRMKSLIGSNNFSDTQLFQTYESGQIPAEDEINLMRISVINFFKKQKQNAIRKS